MRAWTITGVVLVILCVFSSAVWSQTGTTSLRGTVSDSSGGLVAGATVLLANPATGFSRSNKTDSQGGYQFAELPPAAYDLTISADGFATVKQSQLTLHVGTPATLNVSLKVAEASTRIEVSTAAPLVNTVDATLGHAFEGRQIENLPFEGRDPTGILSLQAGVVSTGSNTAQNSAYDSRAGAVAGARSDQANITIDGVDNNDTLLGIAFQGALRATLDSLQEFRVTTTGGGADVGRSSGAQVDLVTKSGTNSFHGSLYEYHRPTFTTANDWFNKHKELESGEANVPGRLIRNTFGGAIGGPIIKDRFFFFYTYEGQHLRESTQVIRTVPSDDMRQGILHYPCTGANCPAGGIFTLMPADIAALDPNCSTPVPGFPQGTCPLGPGVDPHVLPVLNQYPRANTDVVGDGLNIRGYSFTAPAPANLNTNIARLDYKITKSGTHQVFVRGNLQQDTVAGVGQNGPQFPGDAPNQTLIGHNKGIAASYSAALRNNLVNSFRYGYVRQSVGTIGLQTAGYVGWFKMDSLQGETPTSRLFVPIHNIVDDVAWTKGNHTLSFGGNLRIVNNVSSTNINSFNGATTDADALFQSKIANSGQSLDPAAPQFASLNFPAVQTGFGADYDFSVIVLAGVIPNVTSRNNYSKQLDILGQGTLVPRRFRNHEGELYAQDSWRIKPNFTLTAGVRYTLLQTPYETTGTQVSPTISLNDFFDKRAQAMNKGETFNPLIGFQLAGQANGKQPYWPTDYGNIAPRVSFAWSPSFNGGPLKSILGNHGKTSIRGGFGIYYDHFGQGVVNAFNTNGSFGLSSSIVNPLAVLTPDQSPRLDAIGTIPQFAGGCPIAAPPPAPPCTAAPIQILVPPTTGGTFPVFAPANLAGGGFAITWGLDDKLKTPYSEVASLSVTSELPEGFVLEASYIGRFGRRLLQEEDLAMPLDIKDPKSGMDYYTAAQLLGKAIDSNTPIQNLAPIPFWENIFPSAAGPASAQIFPFTPVPCATGAASLNPNAVVTATQAMYNMYACSPSGNATAALANADVPGIAPVAGPGGCFPACATLNGVQTNGYNFLNSQFASLFGWRSIGTSSYNGLQVSLRRHAKELSFDLNYTYSKSFDLGSNSERINEFQGYGLGSQIINAWNPRQNRGPSDFDLRHQINANWLAELPFGTGRRFGSGMHGVANALIGGWMFSGLWRWSSGFPFTILPGTLWATDWQLPAIALQTGPIPKTGTYTAADGSPNVFQDASAAHAAFRAPYAGESGARNSLRGPGVFDIDASLSKTWSLTESKKLIFAWEVFNVTNTVRFDVGSLTLGDQQYSGNNTLTNQGSFGNFTSTLSKPRVMEFSLRFSF